MRRILTAPLFWCLIAEIAGGWACWRWYAGRVTDAPEELSGLLAMLAAIVITIMAKPGVKTPRYPFLLPAILMMAYAAGYHLLFPLARAVLLMTAIASTISVFRFGSYLQPGICGLLWISLPVMPSLQFYIGYPLRSLVANIDAFILSLSGICVYAEGAALRWGNELIVVDAPCSGVKMLWTGIFIACVMMASLRFNWYRGALAVAGTLALVIAGNALRASALFYAEAGILNLPSGGHNGAGIIVFICTAFAICIFTQWLNRRNICVQ